MKDEREVKVKALSARMWTETGWKRVSGNASSEERAKTTWSGRARPE